MRRLLLAVLLFGGLMAFGPAQAQDADIYDLCDPVWGGAVPCIPGPDDDWDGDGDIDADDQAFLDAFIAGDCDYFNSLPDTTCDWDGEAVVLDSNLTAEAPAGPVAATPSVTG